MSFNVPLKMKPKRANKSLCRLTQTGIVCCGESLCEPRFNRCTSSHSQVLSTHSAICLICTFLSYVFPRLTGYRIPTPYCRPAQVRPYQTNTNHCDPRLDCPIPTSYHVLPTQLLPLTCDLVPFVPPFSSADCSLSTLYSI